MKTLVTKLIGTVNNTNIPYFNVVEFKLTRNNPTFTIKKDFSTDVVVAADKGTLTVDENSPSQEITLVKGPNKRITPSPEVTKVYIKTNFDAIQGFLSIDSINGIYLHYIPNCEILNQDRLFASIKDLGENMTELLVLRAISGDLYGDVSELRSNKYTVFSLFGENYSVVGTLENLCEHLEEGAVTSLSVEGTGLTGNIASVCSKVSLSSKCNIYTQKTQISGTVESVISYLTGKKISSEINFYGRNSQVTYNGSGFNKAKFTFGADGTPTLTELT